MEWEDKLKNGESYEGQEMSFGEYADKWLAYMKPEVAYSTYRGYENIVNQKILPFVAVYKVAKIKTPLVEKQIPEQARDLGISEEEVVKNVMLRDTVDGVFTTVEDVANTLVFLANDQGAMTGQSIRLTHGWAML